MARIIYKEVVGSDLSGTLWVKKAASDTKVYIFHWLLSWFQAHKSYTCNLDIYTHP